MRRDVERLILQAGRGLENARRTLGLRRTRWRPFSRTWGSIVLSHLASAVPHETGSPQSQLAGILPNLKIGQRSRPREHDARMSNVSHDERESRPFVQMGTESFQHLEYDRGPGGSAPLVPVRVRR